MTPYEALIREALAAGPTQGPWTAYCRHVSYVDGQSWPHDEFLQWELSGPEQPSGRGDFYQEDAMYIAACNPAAITELLAEIDRLRSAVLAEREACAALCDAADADPSAKSPAAKAAAAIRARSDAPEGSDA